MKLRPVAIVVGQGGYNDIGLIRSCGEANMDVVLICPKNIVVPINKSKYVVDWFPLTFVSETEVMNSLNTCFDKYKGRTFAIYPAADSTALIVDKNYKELSKDVYVPHAYGELYRLMDKAVMVQLASKAGLHVPESISYELSQDSKPSYKGKCIIKPLRSVAGGKTVIQICKSEHDYNEALNNCLKHGVDKILVQDLVEGENQEEVAVTGVSLPNGRIITYGMIHKKRIRGNGSTVFASFSKECPKDIQDQLAAFLKLTKYQGIFDIEFLHNDNGYHFIECNFRNGAYGYAITSAGFNMPLAFYQGIDNQSISPIKVKYITFMEERSDMLNVFDDSMSLFSWLKDFFTCNTLLWWNWRDMSPFFYHIKNHLNTIQH